MRTSIVVSAVTSAWLITAVGATAAAPIRAGRDCGAGPTRESVQGFRPIPTATCGYDLFALQARIMTLFGPDLSRLSVEQIANFKGAPPEGGASSCLWINTR